MPTDPILDQIAGGKSSGGGQGQSLGQKFKQLGRKVQQSPVWKAAQEFAALPSEGVVNVLGAGERANSARLIGSQNNRSGVQATMAGMGAAGPLGLAASAFSP